MIKKIDLKLFKKTDVVLKLKYQSLENYATWVSKEPKATLTNKN